MPFEHMLQNRRTEPLTNEERAVLEAAVSGVHTYDEGEIVVRHGVQLEQSTMLVSGTMTRHLYDIEGRRHLVGLHFAGDFVDLHAYALKVLDHNVGALTKVTVATVPHERLRQIQQDYPHLTRRLWFLTLIDAAMHRQWSFRLASLSAIARIAHFLCETNTRLIAIGLSDGRRFAFNMTQAG
ncbi:MAG: Crp/Fnr family transcriptional regulator, partial [Comamonadaceae bacterium]